jgi:iron(III) transport system substrate-binding protein
LPEVKDAKQWWGGHMWIDNAQRYVYGFHEYLTENIWYNTDMVKPEDLGGYDDLLNPKWKSKIGFLDPRNPGAGDSTWAFMWMTKGKSFLKTLAQQDLLLSRNQRQLSGNVAKGKLAMSIGLTHYTYVPFIRAGLPVRPAPTPREGAYRTGGSGNLTILKNPPHPNAAKVFVNWLLRREGQSIWVKAIKDIPGMMLKKS